VSTDGHTHAHTDAKRFYYLSMLYAIAMRQIITLVIGRRCNVTALSYEPPNLQYK